MNNFWLKKVREKLVLEKESQRNELFLVNDRECFAFSHFTCICFFDCQNYKCGQLSHNYIKHDLGNPNLYNYSYTTF